MEGLVNEIAKTVYWTGFKDGAICAALVILILFALRGGRNEQS